MACEYRLKITWGTADDMEQIRCGRLLLQRLGEVGGALAEVSGALAQLVQQPRVFDGYDGLGGEVL